MSIKQEIIKIQRGFLNARIDEATSMDKLKDIFEDLAEEYDPEDILIFLSGMRLDPEFKDVAIHALEEFEESLAMVV